MTLNDFTYHIVANVRAALEEDVGTGDITASLIPSERESRARIITREPCVMAGRAWVEEVCRQVDSSLNIHWAAKDGDELSAGATMLTIEGNSRSLLTAERTALNFLQLLSGTATLCREYANLVEGTGVKLLDTRKTLPGLRMAQKYAVTCGGCYNHRIGLFDAFLIKENHIHACGGITAAIENARAIAPDKPIEVEVENLSELHEALEAGAHIVMLDNFSNDWLRSAVEINQKDYDGISKLEASGGINRSTLREKASTGVDYISIGALTKHCRAIDLSMRIEA